MVLVWCVCACVCVCVRVCVCACQVCQVSAQQPVQTELLMRHHQLQSRLATLKIENEEVRGQITFLDWQGEASQPCLTACLFSYHISFFWGGGGGGGVAGI